MTGEKDRGGREAEPMETQTEEQELSREEYEHLLAQYENSFKNLQEGQIIRGRVLDRIKGGLAVDIGVKAFLPGSLVDVKPVKNLESLRGKDFDFKVISVDKKRGNIVLSRKA